MIQGTRVSIAFVRGRANHFSSRPAFFGSGARRQPPPSRLNCDNAGISPEPLSHTSKIIESASTAGHKKLFRREFIASAVASHFMVVIYPNQTPGKTLPNISSATFDDKRARPPPVDL